MTLLILSRQTLALGTTLGWACRANNDAAGMGGMNPDKLCANL